MSAKPAIPVLVVEDSCSLARLYSSQLAAEGFAAEPAGSAREAREALARRDYAAVLLDIGLPDGDGMDLLREIAATATAAIMITANASIARAVQAVREGAHDYLVKPVSREKLAAAVRGALKGAAAGKPRRGSEPPRRSDGRFGFVGTSPAMEQVYAKIEDYARSRAAVFITGDSGTGKELCAEAIHASGARARHPFVAINCGAIPKELIESEIFGHLKGSFTGAIADRTGAALQADGGTLFLDEVCEMDPALQTKLLRFVQTGLVRRVGAEGCEPVDVRIVCATNRDPHREVNAGRFRGDLFYRLHVLPLHMPALNQRGTDVTLLARHFLAAAAREEGKAMPLLSAVAERLLAEHPWPGNVRELQNAIRRAVVTGRDEVLTPAAFPGIATAPSSTHRTSDRIAPTDLRALQREAIEASIAACGGSIPKAARLLGVSPSTIYRKRETRPIHASN